MKLVRRLIIAIFLLAVCGVAGLWAYAGPFGFNVLFKHGFAYWPTVAYDSPKLTPAMRLALAREPIAEAGTISWTKIADGFEAGELPVMVDGRAVDRFMLARIDPHLYRFVVKNTPGDYRLDDWMTKLGAALVVNGSYYAGHGEPDTPFVSEGIPSGPSDYDAKAGAFIATEGHVFIQDLAHVDWKTAFQGAQNAMVSYPLLVADGTTRVTTNSHWLANRSFVGEDRTGRIVIGTTTDAFFSLNRLADFLLAAPLDLKYALNLDGGPVASQAIHLNGFDRRTYGLWELQIRNGEAKLLTVPFGSYPLPVVLAVYPK